MKRYRKKPLEIDAIQWDGTADTAHKILQHTQVMWLEASDTLAIETPEGTMRADVGDWVIKGIKGELYPCKPDIFEATYEAV